MISEAASTLTPAADPADEAGVELREHLTFQREEARQLRATADRLAHELALARRLLASFLPAGLADERWPEITAAVRLPAGEFASADGDVRFHLDELNRGRAHTRLRGWAFAPGLTDCAAATILFLLVPVADDPTGTHAVATEMQARPDVAAAFAGLTPAPRNLDHTGFVATVFHPSLVPGEYELCLHIEQRGAGAARRSTGVRLSF